MVDILLKIQNYEKDVISAALGRDGLELYEISKIINFDHPDIDFFPIDCNSSKKMIHFLDLVNYSFDKNFIELISDIHKFFIKKVPINIKIENCVRFIKDDNIKNKIRISKKPFAIKLNNVRFNWYNCQENFDAYHRHSKKYKNYIDDANFKAKVFDQIDCDLIGSKLKNIERYEDPYFGFCKISLRNAAFIIAKINNALLKNDALCFMKHPYVCKMYPMHFFNNEFEDKLSLFDYYFIIVASNSKLNLEKEKKLIKDNEINSFLIGERNGLFYYISNWR